MIPKFIERYVPNNGIIDKGYKYGLDHGIYTKDKTVATTYLTQETTSNSYWTDSTATTATLTMESVDQTIKDVMTQYIGQPYNNTTRGALRYDLNHVVNNVYRNEWLGAFSNDAIATNYTSDIDYNATTGSATVHFNQPLYYTDTAETEINYVTLDSGGVSVGRSTKAQRFRASIRSQMIVTPKSRAQPVVPEKENEKIAIESLREVTTEQEFRRYIKNGFLLVQGASGKVYQIFRENQHTNVWLNGVKVEEFCLRIRQEMKCPETDSVVALKMMIEADETEARKMANLYPMKKAA